MVRLIDLTGEVFGRLVVLSRSPASRRGEPRWFCSCECGGTAVVRGSQLRGKRCRSCGCLKTDMLVERCHRHGHSPMRDKPSRTYYSWAGMLSRCNDPGSTRYPYYGGRGIRACERWHDFRHFLADMGEKPAGMSLDRFPDVDGHYEPGNCRWATAKQQGRNKRNNRLMTLHGITKTMAEWAEDLGVCPSSLSYRVSAGWSDERALTTPLRRW